MKKATIITAFIALLTLMFSITTASAVHLPLEPTNTLNPDNTISCAPSTTLDAHLNTSNILEVDIIPNNCFGLPVTVNLIYNNNTVETFTSTVTTNTMQFSTLTGNPADVDGAQTFINGWFIPTTWTYNGTTTDPIFPNPNTPNITVNTTWNQTAPTQYCVTVNVTTTSTTPINWLANLSYQVPPFNGDNNTSHYQFTYGYGFLTTNPINGVFTIRGTLTSTNTVSSTTPRTFNLCNYNAPPPSISTTAVYSQTETTPTPSYHVCKDVTVSVTNAPFYVGWESFVNVENLKNLYLGSGGQVKGPYGNFSRTLISGYDYRVTGTGWWTQGIRDGSPVTYQICWGS